MILNLKIKSHTIIEKKSFELSDGHANACADSARNQYDHEDTDTQVGIVCNGTDRDHCEDTVRISTRTETNKVGAVKDQAIPGAYIQAFIVSNPWRVRQL